MDKSAYIFREPTEAEIKAEEVARKAQFEREQQELRSKMTPAQLEQSDKILALLLGCSSVMLIKSEK
jgi:hypothetical protein